MTAPMTAQRLDLAARLATQLRVDSIRCTTQASSGHPSSSLSAADLEAIGGTACCPARPRGRTCGRQRVPSSG